MHDAGERHVLEDVLAASGIRAGFEPAWVTVAAPATPITTVPTGMSTPATVVALRASRE